MDFIGVGDSLALIVAAIGAAVGIVIFVVWARETVLPADDPRTWLLGIVIIAAMVVVGATVAIATLTLIAAAITLFGDQGVLLGIAQIVGGAVLLFCFATFVVRFLRER